MGDDDELRTAAQLIDHVDESAEIHVVEGGLDLVENVERAWSRLEQRHKKCHRGKAALATREQGQPLDALTGWASLDIDSRRQHVRRIGEDEPTFASGEQPREDQFELALHVPVGLREDFLHACIHFLDDVEQVVPRALEIVELLGQEALALLQRRVFLQGERVDSAEQRETALGFLESFLLLASYVGVGRRLGLALGYLVARRPRGRGNHLVGAVLVDQDIGLHPELFESLGFQLLDAHALFGAG